MTTPSAAEMNPRQGLAVMTVALCWLVALCEGMDLQAAGVVAGKLAPAFHLGPGPMGWFFSASTAGLLIGAVIGGRLADHFGRKRVLVGSVVVFGLLTAATAMATTGPRPWRRPAEHDRPGRRRV